MKINYDTYDILSTLSIYANYKEEGLNSHKDYVYKIFWKDKLYDYEEIKEYAEGMMEIYDYNLFFENDYSTMIISKDVPKDLFKEKRMKNVGDKIMKKYRETKDNGEVKYNDIFACDVRYDVFVDIYDKEKYKQLLDEDLVIWSKTETDVNLNWKMFQDEISYLRDDMNNSDNFSMKLQLSNGTLHIYTICDEDNSIVMEIYVVPKIITD